MSSKEILSLDAALDQSWKLWLCGLRDPNKRRELRRDIVKAWKQVEPASRDKIVERAMKINGVRGIFWNIALNVMLSLIIEWWKKRYPAGKGESGLMFAIQQGFLDEGE